MPDVFFDPHFPIGLTHSDGQSIGHSHHHPFDNRLAADRNLIHSAFDFRPYFFWKRSTRPAESISFCLPVKKGWQREQISTEISFLIELVRISLPQAHLLTESTN